MWAMRNIDMVEVIRPEKLRNERYYRKSFKKISKVTNETSIM